MRFYFNILICLMLSLSSVMAKPILVKTTSKSLLANYSAKFDQLPKEKKVKVTNIALGAAVLSYGIIKWDYGKYNFHIFNEGWFGQGSKHGGVDKLGHAYSSYLISNLLYEKYLEWGYSKSGAIKNSLISSLIFMNLMEAGDAISSHGISKEDLIMNNVGIAVSYLMHLYPTLNEYLDFRVEYFPTKEGYKDPFTDYFGMKFVTALKLSGFLKKQQIHCIIWI